MHVIESGRLSHFVIPKRAKRKGKMVEQRGSIAPTQGVPPAVDDAHPSSLEPGTGRNSGSIWGIEVDESGREVADFGDGASDPPPPPPQNEQILAPEATPKRPDTSTAVVAQNEVALCQQRLETLLPEVERARAAVGAAVEAKRIIREALDRNREKLALEQRQQLVRYKKKRALELEREDMAIRDARGKVKGLQDDYCAYKNRKAAAEARL